MIAKRIENDVKRGFHYVLIVVSFLRGELPGQTIPWKLKGG